ncbi:hypothetical protein A3Q56_06084 [Intoshia linei]|uniref:Mitochondrial-processing peptidase subunit alpha n=1 Tax=Intoshia linei TaxID=1819745 RepID=A0A177AXU2_9BILA|nr:hypothetical protein A3Q56_06084 [Intoshia linei]
MYRRIKLLKNGFKRSFGYSSCSRSMKTPFHNVDYNYSKTTNFTAYEVETTTLDNGMRICSSPYHGDFITIGVAIKSGSCYETKDIQGVTHFLEKLAFGGGYEWEMLVSFRDVLLYALSINKNGLDVALDVLNETVFKPDFNECELRRAKNTVTRDLQAMDNNQDKTNLVIELAHEAAYAGTTLGSPKFCLKPAIENMNAVTLYSFISKYHTPNRMVLTAIGVDHAELVEKAESIFTAKSTTTLTEEASKYLGGNKIARIFITM